MSVVTQLPLFFGWSYDDLTKTSTGIQNAPPANVWPNLLVTAVGARLVTPSGARATSFYRSPAVTAAVRQARLDRGLAALPVDAPSDHGEGRAFDMAGTDDQKLEALDRNRRFGFFRVVNEGDHLHFFFR